MTGRGRGKEVSLQTEIESQEDWEENIAKEGLLSKKILFVLIVFFLIL